MSTRIPTALQEDVKKTIIHTGLLGPIGAFSTAADVAAIGISWGSLLGKFAEYYHKELDFEAASKICISALLGLGGYYSGCQTAVKYFNTLPIAGTFMAMGISSLQNVVFTYRYAETLSAIFGAGKVDILNLAGSIKTMLSKSVVQEGSDLKGLKDLFFGNSSNHSDSLDAPSPVYALPESTVKQNTVVPNNQMKSQVQAAESVLWKRVSGDEPARIWVTTKNNRSVFHISAKNSPVQVQLTEIKKVSIGKERVLRIDSNQGEYYLGFSNPQLLNMWRLRLKEMTKENDVVYLIRNGKEAAVFLNCSQIGEGMIFSIQMCDSPMRIQLLEIKNVYLEKDCVLRVAADKGTYNLKFSNMSFADTWRRRLIAISTDAKVPPRGLPDSDTAELIASGEANPVSIQMIHKNGRPVFCMQMKSRPLQLQIYEIAKIYPLNNNGLRLLSDKGEYRLKFANAKKADLWKQHLKVLMKSER